MSKIEWFLVTGVPGVGKTTLVQQLSDRLKALGIIHAGFVTAEERSGRSRTGFDVVDIVTGTRAPLARKSELMAAHIRKSFPMVGQYCVDVNSFESIALPILMNKGAKILIVDEIGKMEFFSQKFVQHIGKLMNQPSNGNLTTVIATIPVSKGGGKPNPMLEELRSKYRENLTTVSKENRNDLLDGLVKRVVNTL